MPLCGNQLGRSLCMADLTGVGRDVALRPKSESWRSLHRAGEGQELERLLLCMSR